MTIFVLSMLYLNIDKLHIINSDINSEPISNSKVIDEKDTLSIDTLENFESRPQTGGIEF